MPVGDSVFLWNLGKFLIEVFQEAEGRGRHSVLILHLTHIKLSLLHVTLRNDVTAVVHIDPPYGSLFAKLQTLCLYIKGG